MEHVRDARVLRVLMGRVLKQMGLLDHIRIPTQPILGPGVVTRKQLRGAAFFDDHSAPNGGWSVTTTEKLTPLLPGPSEQIQPFLLSRSQVAKLTGFSEASVIRWENSGLLRPVKSASGRTPAFAMRRRRCTRSCRGGGDNAAFPCRSNFQKSWPLSAPPKNAFGKSATR